MAIATTMRAVRWQIPAPCRCQEVAALPPRGGCDDQILIVQAWSTAGLHGAQIAAHLHRSRSAPAARLFCQTVCRIERRQSFPSRSRNTGILPVWSSRLSADGDRRDGKNARTTDSQDGCVTSQITGSLDSVGDAVSVPSLGSKLLPLQ